jgi:hypothetical protein
MVITPSENFGILSAHRQKDDSRLLDIQTLKSFSLTMFGIALFETISTER